MTVSVCLSVCPPVPLSFCEHISGSTCSIFTNFFVHVTCGCISVLLYMDDVLNEWVIKAGVKRELLDNFKARKLAYNGHTMRKQGSCLEKAIMQRKMPGARRRGRPRTAWMDNMLQLCFMFFLFFLCFV